MRHGTLGKLASSVVLVIGLTVLLPRLASAQSSISGQVKDDSGAVLPGVTVEVASPVLIEGVRSVITGPSGLFTVVDLRPGLYRVTFSLAGFQTLVRSDIDLPSNFTATINVDLKVGSIEETVTVSGQSPTVDVRQAGRTTVLTRDMIDILPVTRNMQLEGAMAPGVKQSAPDVGGAQITRQANVSVHGTTGLHTTMQIDGMGINAAMNDGIIQGYVNDALQAEVSVTTSGIPAEVSAGGVRVNATPKDGGNTVSGAMFLGGTEEPWQGSNLTPELKAAGVLTPNKTVHIRDWNTSIGGPIKRNNLWYFAAWRWLSVDENVVNAVLPNGSPVIINQYVRQPLLRLTWQATPKIKMAAFLERTFKFQSYGDFSPGTEPSRAAQVRYVKCSPFAIGQAKLTSTPSSRILIEAGYSTNIERNCFKYQPGVYQTPFTPGWYKNVAHSDLITSQTTVAASGGERTANTDRKIFSSAFSYVTGTHNFKTGYQWSFGQDAENQSANGDIVQLYRNGKPDSVTVKNTPTDYQAYVNYDLGIYVQDSWKVNRLTLNPGVRFELLNAEMHAIGVVAGRFVPARNFPALKDVPNFRDVAPRFSAVYDLFGDSRTALKGSAGKFMRPWTGGFAKRYSPGVYGEDTRSWTDTDRSGLNLPTNGDDIAQENEIGPTNNALFGVAQTRRPADDLRREYNIEYSASVQQEIARGIAVTGAYFRRTYGNLEVSNNVLVSTGDYIPFQTASPLGNGEMITIYNLNPAKQGQVRLVDKNSSINKQIYNGFEVSFSARLPRGINVFGGFTADQNVTNTCDRVDPNTSGGRFCDQRNLSIPFTKDFKIAGNYPLPYGLQAAANFVSYAGAPLAVNWSVPATVFPNGQRTQSVTVPLIAPGTKYQKQWNQLDVNLTKLFKINRAQYSAIVNVYNILNSSVVLAEVQTFGSSLGQPQRFLLARTMRLAVQVKW